MRVCASLKHSLIMLYASTRLNTLIYIDQSLNNSVNAAAGIQSIVVNRAALFNGILMTLHVLLTRQSIVNIEIA